MPSFRQWLVSRSYSSNTIRNYLADINKYFSVIPQHSDPFDTATLTAYINTLSDLNNTKRYLASLNLFCLFALNQQIISINPIKSLRRQPTGQPGIPAVDLLLQDFSDYLNRHHKTQNTIKNYINDIHQYLDFINLNNSGRS